MTAPDTATPPGEEELSTAERALLDAATVGILLDLRAEDARLDNPSRGAGWGYDRTIRAELLARLVTGNLPAYGGQPRGVKLRGARITGPLDLQGCALASPLLLQDCHIEQPVNLSETIAPAIRLPGCHLPALTARQLQTSGDVQLSDGFTTHGEVNLEGAHVGGHLNLDRAAFANENGPALRADHLVVGQALYSRDFTARGEIRLPYARIGDQGRPQRRDSGSQGRPGADS